MANLFKRPVAPPVTRLPVQNSVTVENARQRQMDEAEDRQGRSSTIMTRGLTASAGKLGR